MLYFKRGDDSPLFFDKYFTNQKNEITMIANEDTQVKSTEEIDLNLEKPKRYYVVMHNDDTTPFDFVIEVLIQLFHHTEQTAIDMAQKIHNEGQGIVGMYYMEIAEQKVEEVTRASRANSFTLACSIEPAE